MLKRQNTQMKIPGDIDIYFKHLENADQLTNKSIGISKNKAEAFRAAMTQQSDHKWIIR